MRKVSITYSLREGMRVRFSHKVLIKRISYQTGAVVILLMLVVGLSLPQHKLNAKLSDYTPVTGNSYNICDETSTELTSPYTYDALGSNSAIQYTIDQYHRLNTDGSENATAPGSAYGTTLPTLPSYILNEPSPTTTIGAEIFAPGSTTNLAAYDVPSSPIVYYFEGGNYGDLGLSTISGDQFYGGSASGYPAPVFNNGGGADGIDAGNGTWYFSGGSSTLTQTAAQGATTLQVANNIPGYISYLTFADGTTYQINSENGTTITLNSPLSTSESQNSQVWANSQPPISSVAATSAQGATSITTGASSIPLVQWGDYQLGMDNYVWNSVSGSQSGYSLGLTAGLDKSVVSGTPIYYNISAGDVTVEYLNINDDQHVTTGTIYTGSGWTIEHNDIHDGYSTPGYGVAIYGGDQGTIEYNCLSKMGDYGVNIFGTNNKFDYNEVYDTNYEQDPGCGCSGGGKWWGTLNADIVGNAFIDDGPGGSPPIWLDNGNAGTLIQGNYFYKSQGNPISDETGFNADVTGNLFVDANWDSGTGPGNTNGIGSMSLNSSGGFNIPNSRYNDEFLVQNNQFYNDWGGVAIWQSGARTCENSGEGWPDDAPYCSGGFPNSMSTQANGQSYFSHETDDYRGGTTNVDQNASSGSTNVLVQGALAIDDQIDFENPSTTSTSQTTNVSTFTGSGSINVTSTSGFPTSGQLLVSTSNGFAALSYTGTTPTSFTGVSLMTFPQISSSGTLTGNIQVNNPAVTSTSNTTNVSTLTNVSPGTINANTTGFPSSGQIRVATSNAWSDGQGSWTGAVLSYSGTTSNTFTGVKLVRGSGTLSGTIQQVQPYTVTAESCYTNDCSVTISPALSNNVSEGTEVTSAGTCQLFATSAATPTAPLAPDGVSYLDGCQWGTANVQISGNTFTVNPSYINSQTTLGGQSPSCSAANDCGTNFMAFQEAGEAPFDSFIGGNAMMSQSGLSSCPVWDSSCGSSNPLKNLNDLSNAPSAPADNGEPPENDVWSDNTYYGPWIWNTDWYGNCGQAPSDPNTSNSMPEPSGSDENNGVCQVNFNDWQSDWEQDAESTQTSLPTVPTNVQATATSNTAVTVSWDASNDNAGPGLGGYYIFRNGSQVGTAGAGATSFNDTGLTAGTSYSYTVEAYDTSNPVNVSGQSSVAAVTTPDGCHVPLYRLRNTHTGDHFYTADLNEYDTVVSSGAYVPEGIVGYVDLTQLSGDIPLYRLRNTTSGIHFYTTSSTEETSLVASGGYALEGIAGYVAGSSGSGVSELYRLRNVSSGVHFYTASSSEESSLVASGQYVLEGSAGYTYTGNVSSCHEPLYRLRQVSNGVHFYTASLNEAVSIEASGAFVPEGTAGYIDSTSQSGDEPLYRLRQVSSGIHFYTTSSSEESGLLSQGYVSEGVAGYVQSASGSGLSELYRLRQVSNGIHFYTDSSSEESSLVSSNAFVSEGGVGYVYGGE